MLLLKTTSFRGPSFFYLKWHFWRQHHFEAVASSIGNGTFKENTISRLLLLLSEMILSKTTSFRGSCFFYLKWHFWRQHHFEALASSTWNDTFEDNIISRLLLLLSDMILLKKTSFWGSCFFCLKWHFWRKHHFEAVSGFFYLKWHFWRKHHFEAVASFIWNDTFEDTTISRP